MITPPQEKDLEEFVVSKLYKLVYSYCIVYCQVSDNCVFVCIVKLVTIEINFEDTVLTQEHFRPTI